MTALSKRRLGLQDKWIYVVDSLENIVESYEAASRSISLFRDSRMRLEVVQDVSKGSNILDMGSGPGTLSRLVTDRGANVVLLDFSRRMLLAKKFDDRVQGTFEFMPFREKVFDSVLSAFAFRDAFDAEKTLEEVKRVLKEGGNFSFCDLGKPDSLLSMLLVAFYIRVFPALIGVLFQGRRGLRYGSLFITYILMPKNSTLEKILRKHFREVKRKESMLGGAVVFKCIAS